MLDQCFPGVQPVCVGYTMEKQQQIFRTALCISVQGCIFLKILFTVSGTFVASINTYCQMVRSMVGAPLEYSYPSGLGP